MSSFASVSPWLPILKEFLPSVVVLGEKAAELYHLSLMEKPVALKRIQTTHIGVEKSGKKHQDIHDHLIQLGFRRVIEKIHQWPKLQISYFREDLGKLGFFCPQIRSRQKPAREGLAAMPDKRTAFLIENPHCVEVQYLGVFYEVFVPQVGRFILDNNVDLKGVRFIAAGEIYKSARRLSILLELLVAHAELQEETFHDFLEIRPPSLVKNFLSSLKKNGPGSLLWDSAQKLYLERHPEAKIISLTRWYWDFLRKATRFLEKHKDPIL